MYYYYFIEVLPQLYKSQCGLNLIGDESRDNTRFASAICLQILPFFTFTHNLRDDLCNFFQKARVWIYCDFKCLLVWMDVFLRRHS